MPVFVFEQLVVRVQKLRYCATAETAQEAERLIAAGAVVGQPVGDEVVLERTGCSAVLEAGVDAAGCPVWRPR